MDQEKQSLKLIPVYDPNALLRSFNHFVDGIEAVLNNSGADTSFEKIFNELMSGKLLLWASFVDGRYMGFVTTQVTDIPTCGKFLWIVHAYKNPKYHTSWLFEALKVLEKFARERGCSSIRFYAKEKKWQERLVPLGYQPGYIEYVKELKDESVS